MDSSTNEKHKYHYSNLLCNKDKKKNTKIDKLWWKLSSRNVASRVLGVVGNLKWIGKKLKYPWRFRNFGGKARGWSRSRCRRETERDWEGGWSWRKQETQRTFLRNVEKRLVRGGLRVKIEPWNGIGTHTLWFSVHIQDLKMWKTWIIYFFSFYFFIFLIFMCFFCGKSHADGADAVGLFLLPYWLDKSTSFIFGRKSTFLIQK